MLAAHFLKKEAEHYDKELTGFDSEAIEALMEHPWPGNVRELQHVVERAVLLAQGEQVGVDALNLRTPPAADERLEKMTLDDAEKVLIQKALTRFDGNVSRAAEALGLSRSALYRRLQRYDL